MMTLEQAEPIQLLFVCLGNICRSPTAEAAMQKLLAREKLTQHILVDSAGTGGWHVGAPADARSREAARARGIFIESRARKVSRDDFARFDYLLAMDRDNESDLLDLAPSQDDRSKVHLFRNFDPHSPSQADVPDPYYGGEDGFEQVLDLCERAAAGLLQHLRETYRLS